MITFVLKKISILHKDVNLKNISKIFLKNQFFKKFLILV